MKYDIEQEAMALTNQLYHRDGHVPKPLQMSDAALVCQTIKDALQEAFEAGKQ
jgi:hypothetical protein